MNLRLVIISGGQTGADRAALDWALRNDLPHGGWCPKGRVASDGPLDECYRLKETPTDDLLQRTEWNVKDSDATVVFTLAPKALGGSAKALSYAKKYRRPSLHLHQGMLAVAEKLAAFLAVNAYRRLNVAGSQESEEPGIYDWVLRSLDKTKSVMDREV
ncbi:MAG: putative molybdenum carrier protein [Roseimicrobium sp.]